MGIYYWYSLFRKRQGALIDNLNYLRIPQAALARISCPSYWPGCLVAIEFRRYLYLEDMVKCYIHEILHCAYQYDWILDIKKKQRSTPYYFFSKDIDEEDIDKEMEEIYQMQPRFVERLRKDLEEAFINLESLS